MARFTGVVVLGLALLLGNSARAGAQPQNPVDMVGQWTSNINVPYTVSLKDGVVTWSTPMGEAGTIVSAPGGLQTTWTDALGVHTASGAVVARDAAGRPIRVQWSNGLVIERTAAQAAGVPVPGAPPVGTPASVADQAAQQATQQAMGLLGALVAKITQPQPPAPAGAPAAAVPSTVPPPAPVVTPTPPVVTTYPPAGTTYPPAPPPPAYYGTPSTTAGTVAIPPGSAATAGSMTVGAPDALGGVPLRPGPAYLERIIGGRASSGVVQVGVVPPGGTPFLMPKPIPTQAALFYAHVVGDLLGQDDVLDLSQKTLLVKMREPGMPPGSPEELLSSSLAAAFGRAADMRAIEGSTALAVWYGQWAEWFARLGVDLGDPSATATTASHGRAWAMSQPPDVLKKRVSGFASTVMQKLSVTPISF